MATVGAAPRRIRWRLGLEAAALTAGLVVLALMVRALPLVPAARELAWSLSLGDLAARGTVAPAQRGINRVELTLTDAAGQPVTAAEVEVAFLPVGGGGVIARRPLAPMADRPGWYAAGGLALTRSGPWQMLVTVRRPDQPNGYASLDWQLGPDNGLWQSDEAVTTEARLRGWLNTNGPALLGAVALLGVGGWGWRAWQALRRGPAALVEN